ncbi:metallophosphoesterase [Niallia circulans]
MNRKRHFAFLFSIITTLALLVSVISPASTYAEESNNHFKLTIMHMNDTHARADLLPNMITAIKEVRAEDPNALVFNAGDVFSGTLYFNEYRGKADLALLNMMNLDGMIFGNHEFDLGSNENGHKSLAEFVKGAKFPFLAANVDFSGDDFMKDLQKNEFSASPEDGKIFNGIVKEINGEKVGIFGLTTEDTANISSPVNVKFLDYIKKAENAVKTFEDMGINKIIAVTHIGYDSNPDFGNDLQLAKYVDGIDVIVGGHSHTQLDEPTVIKTDENGVEKDPTLIVQAYQYAQYLGKLAVEFDENGVVSGHEGQLINASQKKQIQKLLLY